MIVSLVPRIYRSSRVFYSRATRAMPTSATRSPRDLGKAAPRGRARVRQCLCFVFPLPPRLRRCLALRIHQDKFAQKFSTRIGERGVRLSGGQVHSERRCFFLALFRPSCPIRRPLVVVLRREGERPALLCASSSTLQKTDALFGCGAAAAADRDCPGDATQAAAALSRRGKSQLVLPSSSLLASRFPPTPASALPPSSHLIHPLLQHLFEGPVWKCSNSAPCRDRPLPRWTRSPPCPTAFH